MSALNPYAKAFVAWLGAPVTTLLGNLVLALQTGIAMNWKLQAAVFLANTWGAVIVYFVPNAPKEEKVVSVVQPHDNLADAPEPTYDPDYVSVPSES